MSNLKIKIQNLDKKSNYSNNKNNSSSENKNLLEIEINQNTNSQNNNKSTSSHKDRSTFNSKDNSSENSSKISLLNSGNKILNTNFNTNFGKNKELLEKKINDGRNSTKIIYYIRALSTDKKYKYQGVEKMTITFVLGEYDDILPSYIFGNKHFSFTPHHCYQLANKNKGYIISFANLIDRFKRQLIANDQKNIYTYLFKQKRGKQIGIDIKKKDFKTLNSNGLINDGIINFYFKLIEDECFNINKNFNIANKYQINNYAKKNKNKVLAMKSYFYNMLSNNQNEELSNSFTYPDSCSYSVTKINIFTFKTMLVPICEKNHWSLIIVNNINTMHNIFDFIIRTKYRADYVYEDIDACDNNGSSEIYPEIYYLDSYFCNVPRRINIILKYLFYEYQKVYLLKYGICYPQFNLTNFIFRNYQKIQCYRPEVPKQNNKYDCGIFILLYTELFLFDPDFFFKYARNANQLGLIANNNFNKEENNNVFINNNINHLNNMDEENDIKDNLLRFWFNTELVNSKRKNIQSLILELSNLQMRFEQYDDNEDYYDEKLKSQSDIIEKYICEQKELYRQYFKKLQEEKHF